jgi:hypothetical protein
MTEAPAAPNDASIVRLVNMTCSFPVSLRSYPR